MAGFDDLRVPVDQQCRIGVAQHPRQIEGVVLVLVGIFPIQFIDHPGDRLVGVGKIGGRADQMVSALPPVPLDRLDDQRHQRTCPG